MPFKIEFTPEEEQEIVRLYQQEKWSLQKIANEYLVSQSVIERVLRDNKVWTRQGTRWTRGKKQKIEEKIREIQKTQKYQSLTTRRQKAKYIAGHVGISISTAYKYVVG